MFKSRFSCVFIYTGIYFLACPRPRTQARSEQVAKRKRASRQRIVVVPRARVEHLVVEAALGHELGVRSLLVRVRVRVRARARVRFRVRVRVRVNPNPNPPRRWRRAA